MTVKVRSSPFGSQSRTAVMLGLERIGESYARELARVLDMPLSSVQQALASLEKDGLIAGRAVGRTRLFRLDPRYFARDTLAAYLRRLVEPEEELQAAVQRLRLRPRRTSKPL